MHSHYGGVHFRARPSIDLAERTQARLDFFDGMIRVQGLRRVLKAGDLEAAHGDRAPAIVVGGPPRNAWPDSGDFPVDVRLLRQKGFSDEEVSKLVGGNYVRVFNASVRAA